MMVALYLDNSNGFGLKANTFCSVSIFLVDAVKLHFVVCLSWFGWFVGLAHVGVPLSISCPEVCTPTPRRGLIAGMRLSQSRRPTSCRNRTQKSPTKQSKRRVHHERENRPIQASREATSARHTYILFIRVDVAVAAGTAFTARRMRRDRQFNNHITPGTGFVSTRSITRARRCEVAVALRCTWMHHFRPSSEHAVEQVLRSQRAGAGHRSHRRPTEIRAPSCYFERSVHR